MFDLVVDVANYPDFLPWCVASRVREKSDTHIVADLVIGFKMVRERFTSRVSLDRDNLVIDTALVEGPFKHMTNNWRFRLMEDGKSAEIDIHVDFAFRSALLQRLLEPVFGVFVLHFLHCLALFMFFCIASGDGDSYLSSYR